jgi:hypothetical protein
MIIAIELNMYSRESVIFILYTGLIWIKNMNLGTQTCFATEMSLCGKFVSIDMF